MNLLPLRTADTITSSRLRLPGEDVVSAVRAIIADVRSDGLAALRRLSERLGDSAPGAPLILGPTDMRRALDGLPRDQRSVLERTAARIRNFADAQRACLRDLDLAIDGGAAGHRFRPVARAGCYAPGGRYPLPSSVLMGAITARAAGVPTVIVASPRPAPATLAAAAIAGADQFLATGGAQAIAALAYGLSAPPPELPLAPVDLIVGPGNNYVTAAKAIVFGSGTVGIDMLAGPSEILIIADDAADPTLVAADLLAQAEHDADAVPMLISTCEPLAAAVRTELVRLLTTLPTAATARAALANGFCCIVPTLDDAITLSDRLAPEHLEIITREPQSITARCSCYGAIFVGPASAEVLGDYGAGPNHTLPTAGTARFTGGLSVLTFLRCNTYLRADPASPRFDDLARDAASLARIEGLEAHARAAEIRLTPAAASNPRAGSR
jgi:phosphoribosyl-ATP pyrophosphohydrolase/phosphoribosyl-AMP cyclohydrolase/histidinol dehydrogenase